MDVTRQPEDDEERLPSFAEQMADQLGGWRGLVESSVPVVVFVFVNIIAELNPALIASVGVALAIAALRLIQRRPVRHAVNGLFGVGIGAFIAWRTGDEKDFYLPGILYGIGYGLALLLSVAVRQPLVGWIWSVIVARGKSEWRTDPKLIRLFSRLTILWGVVWLAKVGVQAALYLADQDTALGVARLVLGYPPYLLLLAFTVWAVRRVTKPAPETAPA
ncbi:membrane protein [Phytohabitans suffuscus]|uniref:Membrane protein n=1 Tax=Phytohabitans suffuscus TaxID=624315 RepID=A0A6F8YNZ3_9ACTN|nr:membrane protein [Phytohabitans suffuscus]